MDNSETPSGLPILTPRGRTASEIRQATLASLNEGDCKHRGGVPVLQPTPFPDKWVDRVTPSRASRLGTPRERLQGSVFRRRISFGSSGTSSGENSPCRRSRLSSTGPAMLSGRLPSPDAKARPVTYLVNNPKLMRVTDSNGNMSAKAVLVEVSREQTEDNRPPSPMPANELQNCVEHNKQMMVWDEWVSNSNADCNIASISYKRVESRNIVETKPKALKPPTVEDLDMED